VAFYKYGDGSIPSNLKLVRRSEKKGKAISENELVRGCVENKRFYQEMLYKKYFDVMMRMCLRYTRQEDVAVTILNDGLLKVFQKIHLFGFKGSLEGWIRRLVFHAISDYFKKENKYLKLLVFDDIDQELPASAISDMYYEEILKLLDNLPYQSQRVFRLYAIEGFNHAEIAAKLKIKEGTSKWHLSEARKKLKSLISRENLYIQKHG